mmetsp:Transcript_76690/g.211864  ORF Transcript_76690/g.211864 Transcript_76690/m.211864 type:complete len:128 (+) Transcript_76690:1158-1541(+)
MAATPLPPSKQARLRAMHPTLRAQWGWWRHLCVQPTPRCHRSLHQNLPQSLPPPARMCTMALHEGYHSGVRGGWLRSPLAQLQADAEPSFSKAWCEPWQQQASAARVVPALSSQRLLRHGTEASRGR